MRTQLYPEYLYQIVYPPVKENLWLNGELVLGRIIRTFLQLGEDFDIIVELENVVA